MTFFFWSPLHFGQKIGHLASDDLFFGLHFIALHCHGQKFGQPRWDVKFAKLSSPHSQKIAKNDQFCRIIPPTAQHRIAPLSVLYNAPEEKKTLIFLKKLLHIQLRVIFEA